MMLFPRLAATRSGTRGVAVAADPLRYRHEYMPCASRLTMLTMALLLAFASTAWAQQRPAANVAHVGYIYPAGACQGATTRAVAGGEFLDGVSQAYVSGSGVQITVKDYTKPLTPPQFTKLRDSFKELTDRRHDAYSWPKMSPASRPSTRPVFTADDAKLLEEVRDKLATALVKPAFPAIAEIVELEITVAKDAAPGRREVRFQTAGGLTNPLVFYVGQLPEVSENRVKPRPQATVSIPGKQMTVNLPVMINGQIGPGGVNRYQFQARKGQSLVAYACARGLTPYLADAVPGWFQATLTLDDAAGHELAADDDSRVDHDPLLHYVIPADGQYVVEIKDALYRGREDFVYRLSLDDMPFVASAFPLADPAHKAGDIPECLTEKIAAQAVNLPIIINGRIAAASDCATLTFPGKSGEQIVAEVTACRLGSPLDSILELTDAAGKQLACNDDFNDPAAGLITHQADSYLTATLPADGTYFIHLRDVQNHGGPDYAYRLRISQPRPDFQLLLEPSSINVRAGDSATVTVHAVRRDGFAGAITVIMSGDSQGFRLGSTIIPAKQDKADLKLLAPPTASSQAVRLHMEGYATIDGQQVTRQVVPVDNTMQAFAYWHLVPAEELLATVLPPRVRPSAVAVGNIRPATLLTAKYVAEQMGLSGDAAERFVSIYVGQRMASFQQLREAAANGKAKETVAAVSEAARAMQAVLETNLGAALAPKAADLLGPLYGVLEKDVAALLELDVPQAKVLTAMPVLSGYVRAAKTQVYEQINTGVLTRADGVARIHGLRVTAAKDLAPIIGADAANKWAEQQAMGLQTRQP